MAQRYCKKKEFFRLAIEKVIDIRLRIDKFRREHKEIFSKKTDKEKAILVYDKDKPYLKRSDNGSENKKEN